MAFQSPSLDRFYFSAKPPKLYLTFALWIISDFSLHFYIGKQFADHTQMINFAFSSPLILGKYVIYKILF